MDGQSHTPTALLPGNRNGPHCEGDLWVPGPFWTCAAYLFSFTFRTPDRPDNSQSLYRLHCPSPHDVHEHFWFSFFFLLFPTCAQPTYPYYVRQWIMRYLRRWNLCLTLSHIPCNFIALHALILENVHAFRSWGIKLCTDATAIVWRSFIHCITMDRTYPSLGKCRRPMNYLRSMWNYSWWQY